MGLPERKARLELQVQVVQLEQQVQMVQLELQVQVVQLEQSSIWRAACSESRASFGPCRDRLGRIELLLCGIWDAWMFLG